MNLRQKTGRIVCLVAVSIILTAAKPAHSDIVTVLFTGFNPDNPSGMDFLNDTLISNFANDFPGQSFSSGVFAYNDRNSAFNFINNHSEIDQLFLVGHSWGGNALIRLAQNLLLPNSINVDATFQIDSVDIFDPFDPGIDDNVLPANVDNGFNYYQIPTGFLEPGGEQNVLGAININVEVLFNDTTITHTSIDNDTRLHDLIYFNMRSAIIPEPGSSLVIGFGVLVAVFTRTRRRNC